VPIDEVLNFLPPRLQDYDVAIGSREQRAQDAMTSPFTDTSWAVFSILLSGCCLFQVFVIRNAALNASGVMLHMNSLQRAESMAGVSTQRFYA